MNFINRTNSSHNEQAEQKLQVGIRELAPRENGYERIDDDVQLARNNLETLMRRMSLTSTREIDSLIYRAESFACKDSQGWIRIRVVP